MWKRIVISILVFIILAGCGTQNISTSTPSSTPTLLPTKATTPEPTVTLTSLPTLSSQETYLRIKELLKPSEGCELPCWWGIKPSQTSKSEASSIFETLSTTLLLDQFIYKITIGDEYLSLHPLSSGFRIVIRYFTIKEVVTRIYVDTEMMRDPYTKIYNDPTYQEIMSEYTLESILTKYGIPNQILFRTFSNLAGEFNPARVLLYYPEEGIVVQYFSPNGLLKENNSFILPTCPPIGHISLRIFEPDKNFTLKEIFDSSSSFSQYKNISEVTNMDIETFYETYREYDEELPNCPATLKTPEDIWPSEYSP